MLKSNKITLIHEVRSGREILPAGTVLTVIRANEDAARCVDVKGYIHVIRRFIKVRGYQRNSEEVTLQTRTFPAPRF